MTPYRIVASEVIRQQMRQLTATATLEGREQQLNAALVQLVQRLTNDPLEFGEPRYHLREMDLHLRRGAIAPLLVNYGVNVEHRFVVIQGFDLLSA
jgi:hypothetical protein